MAFQFRCACSRMLEVDVEDIGEHVICPYCCNEISVPHPRQIDPLTRMVRDPLALEEFESDAAFATEPSSDEATPHIHRRQSVQVNFDDDVEDVRNNPSPVGLDEPDEYRLPCECGFVMEVPSDMLGTEALCPACEKRMSLHLRDTVEFQRRKEWEEQREETRLGKFWLNTAIVTASLVVLGIVLLTLNYVMN